MLASVDQQKMVIADLDAGLGTLIRLDDFHLDGIIAVVEATPKSLEMGRRSVAMARERSVGALVVVANRVHDEAEAARVRDAFPGCEVVVVPDDAAIVEADRAGVSPLDISPESPAVTALVGLGRRLMAASA